jgi:nucleotide-binding universal stress UspA family protein
MPEHRVACDEYLRSVADSDASVATTCKTYLPELGQSIADAITSEVDRTPQAMVCMSMHGRSGIGAAVLGTPGEEILRTLDQPVLVVGQHCVSSWTGHGRLLLPLDGSPEANDILASAIALARGWNLDTSVLQVVHPFDNDVADQAVVVERACATLRAARVHTASDVDCSSDAAAAIAGRARRDTSSLIMMSSHVRPGAARAFLGSVTMNTIRSSPCPMLVCPPHPATRSNFPLSTARPEPLSTPR